MTKHSNILQRLIHPDRIPDDLTIFPRTLHNSSIPMFLCDRERIIATKDISTNDITMLDTISLDPDGISILSLELEIYVTVPDPNPDEDWDWELSISINSLSHHVSFGEC